MKKLVLLMAVMLGMAFVSCTGCADKEVINNDSDSVAIDTAVVVDSTVTVDTLVTDSVK